MNVYSLCVHCDNQLNENDQLLNKSFDNITHPLCSDCVRKHIRDVEIILDIAD